MERWAVWGVVVPFWGTVLGAALAFAVPRGVEKLNRFLCGLAAGAMTASGVWSLLIPALELGALPVAGGFLAGFLILLLPDRVLGGREEGQGRYALLLLAVVLHNIPEGLAVGAGYAGALNGAQVTGMDALTLALGIAMQNIPDGAVIVLPLAAMGMKRRKAFGIGVLSGAVEPVAAVATLWLAPMVAALLPGLMGFAAGAMLFVVVRELVPRMEESPGDMCAFAAGFLLLMGMDAGLG